MNATIDTGDGPVVINPKRVAMWIGIALGLITLTGTASNYIAGMFVKPKQLNAVTEKLEDVEKQQEASRNVTARLSLRVDTLNEKMADFSVVAEILVIDVCARNKDNPYVMRRIDCDGYVR